MEKAIVVVVMALTVLAFGLVAVAINAPEVSADNCGGAGQPTCDEYCVDHPSAPECRCTTQESC